jgi:alpha-D-xyloside xylohydrolase
VQDWYSWEENHWGEKKVDKARYGNLRERIDQIHELNVHTMVSVWPNMNAGTTNHTEFLEQGYLLNDLCTYDAFSEEARQLYWKQAKEELFDGGFDSWWCDSTEPFSGPDWNGEEKREPWERYMLVGNEHKHFLDPEYANVYALVHAKGIYENQRITTEEKRVLNLTRSGYASSQRYGAMLWSGDTSARWPVLKQQIAEGLNMGLSGYPYWTLDIGAFFTVKEKWQNRGCCCNTDPTMKWFWQGDYNEGVKDKGYQELYTRWYQLGAFLPMFRSHGTDTPREIWNFGQKGDLVYDTLEAFTHLRYRLMPYIYSLAGNVYLNHGTIMRSLLFDFASDPKAAAQDGEYMFGPSLLVCPVTEPMYYGPESTPLDRPKTWTCYLPSGCRWYDSWGGTVYEGGVDVTVDAPLSRMPLFIREGSILPLTRGLQYADQKPEEPMELRVYPGADGSFTLYEDEGDNYNFEHGSYSTIRFDWNEAAHTLTIGKRRGFYQGMEETRRFKVCLAHTLCGSDDMAPVLVSYDGREQVISLN